MPLLWIVGVPLLAAAVLPVVAAHGGRRASALAALAVTLSALAVVVGLAPGVLQGGVVQASWPWVPDVGLSVSLRLDGLSLLLAGLIAGMGALIVLYAAYYLGPHDLPGKFYATLMLFMAAMLGVVLADNLLLLAVFWELTSLASFLLVGYWSHDPQARAGARQALAVTGGGGLALLGGVVLLGWIAGTYDISEMVGRRAEIQADPLFTPALLLILLGAFTKSAQVPFHFWLPDAMAAPTPVSAYLHSATMVKAGIFLLMRLHPVLAGSGLFETLVSGVGLLTVAWGAWVAIFKHDLKGLLAYSTVSHLGLIMFLVGVGSPLAAVAAVLHVLNHATFKAPLFMVAGIVDHETGSRDLRRLGGLFALMPWTGTLALLAAASMAGVPLTNGFVSKEMFLAEAVGTGGWLVPLVATLAGACSVAYALRLVHDAFFHGPLGDVPNPHPHEPPWGMRVPPTLLVGLALAAGLAPGPVFGPWVHAAATVMVGQPLPPYTLTPWHGFNLPLLLSGLALAGGVWLYARLQRGRWLHRVVLEERMGPWQGRRLFERGVDGLMGWAGRATAALDNGSLQRMVAWLVGTAVVAGGAALLGQGLGAGGRALWPANPLAWAVWLLLLATCAALVRMHHQRLLAVVLVGVVGLVTSLTFVAFSAPDLALTQLSVELVSTVLLLMGLALLPQHSPRESSPQRRLRDGALALAAGAGLGWITWVLLTRDHDSIAWYFLQQSLPKGGGANVVNVILVDFRGYDTLGEITVLGIAAVGVLALMEGLRMARPPVDAEGRRWTFAEPPLLLRVAAAVVLPAALVVAVYIFVRGHNAPGGGFIAGLITAVALVLQAMARGLHPTEALLRAHGGRRFVRWLGAGLGVAGLTGVGAFVWGRPFLTSAHGHLHLPLLGDVPLATAALFDLGVYGTVVGATLLTISALGNASRAGAAPVGTAQEGRAS
ncbi:MAG: monovalent cation/H+ antiporter subunit A [Tepidimonas ignava]|uniref:Multisubunit potassium/proton antiporter PhaA subunit /multisubunit potassium/proton antiporter PhaB subunit n=1 Tax=Tepidimonas ignava TaxID=114249 RepID=A0A4R3LIJ4_9BURK|nr:monovalent cation/H+ antiporter subunit A [Tepidimonas ignava]MCX7692141.1 monovalent cation/H+ antiporter subunit A [Tepidimonas taiwanensis]TCS99550.1 multisubunit potassium/proton antiporter PhaA subunit /multisubunit potassium/proton antiporter PhaB subunit [Tepidimonas ignava]TSE18612.1 Na(+)/H(+) antiporter subunit A [Tepidimonas ignava]